jgi:hypothetical protein
MAFAARSILLSLAFATTLAGASEPVQRVANGMEHRFVHQVVQGAGDREAALRAVDFIYSKCFWDSFAAIGGKPFTPSPQTGFVSTVLEVGGGFQVVTGPRSDGDSYRLEKTGDACGFRIAHARSARTSTSLPESYAKEMARNQAQAQAQLMAQQRVPPDRSWIAIPAMWAAFVFGLLGLVAPWFFLPLGRDTVAVVSGVLAGCCTIAAMISAYTMPGGYNIRVDLVINGFLILACWSLFAGLLLWALAGGRKES